MSYFLLLLQIIPAIIALVKQVEVAIPGKSQGAAKLDLVLSTVNAALAAVPQIMATIGSHDLNGTITAIVAAVVASMNRTGGFTTTPPLPLIP